MTANRKRRSERLLARMSRLAQEKSNLQLVNNLVCSLGGIAGLDNIVDRMLHLLSDQLGVQHRALLRAFENTTFTRTCSARSVVEKIDDDGAARVRDRPARRGDALVRGPGMLTREFTRAS